MNYQCDPEFEEVGIQTDENSMDQYDCLEYYFNSEYYLNQDQLLEELYNDPLEEINTKVSQKTYSHSLGNLEEFQIPQGRPQTFNFQALEKYSETIQQSKKQPQNIGQMYLQQLEKQAQTLKKINLKFSVNNDENQSFQSNQRKGSTLSKASIRNSIIDTDLSQQYKSQDQKRGSCQTYFQDSKTNTYLRFSNKNEESANSKYHTQQLFLPNNLNEHNYIKQKYKGLSQHSINNLVISEDTLSQSPSKRQIQISKKIRAMTSNQQLRSNFRNNVQTESQNLNQQVNQLKSIFSDFQQDVKQRENQSTSIPSNVSAGPKIELPNKAIPLTNILSSQNQLYQNIKSISAQKQSVKQNQRPTNQKQNARLIQSAKQQNNIQQFQEYNKFLQNPDNNNLSSTQSTLPSQQNIQYKKSIKQVQFQDVDQNHQKYIQNNQNTNSISCIN